MGYCPLYQYISYIYDMHKTAIEHTWREAVFFFLPRWAVVMCFMIHVKQNENPQVDWTSLFNCNNCKLSVVVEISLYSKVIVHSCVSLQVSKVTLGLCHKCVSACNFRSNKSLEFAALKKISQLVIIWTVLFILHVISQCHCAIFFLHSPHLKACQHCSLLPVYWKLKQFVYIAFFHAFVFT